MNLSVAFMHLCMVHLGLATVIKLLCVVLYCILGLACIHVLFYFAVLAKELSI